MLISTINMYLLKLKINYTGGIYLLVLYYIILYFVYKHLIKKIIIKYQ